MDKSIQPIAFWRDDTAKRVMRWVRLSGGLGSQKVSNTLAFNVHTV